jgi:hypothetical protein
MAKIESILLALSHGVYYVLKRHGLHHLPQKAGK